MADAPAVEPKLEIPNFFDEEKNLRDLNRRNFPRGRDGKIAFLEYRVVVAKARLEEFLKGDGPFNRRKKQIAKMRAKLAKLEAEFAAMEQDKENSDE